MKNSKYIFFNVVTLISLIVASHSVSYARKTFFEVDQKESKVGFMVKHKITKDVYGGLIDILMNYMDFDLFHYVINHELPLIFIFTLLPLLYFSAGGFQNPFYQNL